MTDSIKARLPWLGYPTHIYDVPDLTVNEFAVFVVLWSYATRDGTNCFPSLATLAGQARVSKRTVQRAVRVLEELGLVKVVGNMQGANTYELSTVRSSRGDCVTRGGVTHSHGGGDCVTTDEMPLMGCQSSSEEDGQVLDRKISGMTRQEWANWWLDAGRHIPNCAKQDSWGMVAFTHTVWQDLVNAFEGVRDVYPDLKLALEARLKDPTDGYMLDRAWFGLRWLLSDHENLLKFLEGAYVDKKKRGLLRAEEARRARHAESRRKASEEARTGISYTEFKEGAGECQSPNPSP